MKKTASIFLAALLAVSFAACGSPEPSSSQGGESGSSASQEAVSSSSGSSSPAASPSQADVPSSQEDPASAEPSAPSSQAPEEVSEPQNDTQAQGGETLVAYFSWSGNTRQMAETIAQETGGDLFEIVTVTPYTDDYNELLDIAQQEQGEDARPELDAQVENWDSYDTVFVGYPNWWSDAPMAVYTFLESYDFTGKTLIPFNTSASGGFGRSLTGIAESASSGEILEGLDLTESELGDVQNRVTAWLGELGLNG